MRPLRALAASTLLVPLLAVTAASTPASGATGSPWCHDEPEPSRPCLRSVEVAGELAGWSATGSAGTVVGNGSWVLDTVVDEDLGPDEPPVTMTFAMRGIVPRVVVVRGAESRVTRLDDEPGHYETVVHGRPVPMTGTCSGTPGNGDLVCGEVESGGEGFVEEWAGRFGALVTDARFAVVETGERKDRDDPEGLVARVRAALTGLDVETDAAAVAPLPTVSVVGKPRIEWVFGNRQYDSRGGLWKGRFSMMVPEEFLRTGLGIPDPASLRPVGLASSLTGRGQGEVVVVREGTAMRVTATGITYPRAERALRVALGNIKPTRPAKVKTMRTGPRKAKITFRAAAPRGAQVIGYKAKCTAGKHKVTATSKAAKTKVVAKKLRKNTRYTCQVRASTEAGQGPWSAKKKVKPRP